MIFPFRPTPQTDVYSRYVAIIPPTSDTARQNQTLEEQAEHVNLIGRVCEQSGGSCWVSILMSLIPCLDPFLSLVILGVYVKLGLLLPKSFAAFLL